MRFSSLRLIPALILALAAAVVPATAQRNIGEIVESHDARQIAVQVASTSADVQRLAAGAFSAHGAFRVDGRATTILRFNPVSAQSVQLVVEQAGRTTLNQTVQGTSQRNAVLRAADMAVTHVAKLPGFFAGKLAFVSERTGHREVYVSDFFFGEIMQMTQDRSQSVMPRWSPDGRRILYTTYFQTGFPDIFIIDVATRQRVPFVTLKGTNTGARFSPDGTSVAMILSGEGNPEVYVSNAQGRNIRRLTRTPSIESTPSWSPDGSRLVVTSDAAGRPQLYTLAVGGGALQRIPTNISGYCAEPDWNHANPDLLAFTVAEGRGMQVAVYSFSKRESRVVTRGGGDAVEPTWLNDGRHLLYTIRSANNERIAVLDTETGKSTVLSPANLGKTSQVSFTAR
jgi:TolB protein